MTPKIKKPIIYLIFNDMKCNYLCDAEDTYLRGCDPVATLGTKSPPPPVDQPASIPTAPTPAAASPGCRSTYPPAAGKATCRSSPTAPHISWDAPGGLTSRPNRSGYAPG